MERFGLVGMVVSLRNRLMVSMSSILDTCWHMIPQWNWMLAWLVVSFLAFLVVKDLLVVCEVGEELSFKVEVLMAWLRGPEVTFKHGKIRFFVLEILCRLRYCVDQQHR